MENRPSGPALGKVSRLVVQGLKSYRVILMPAVIQDLKMLQSRPLTVRQLKLIGRRPKVCALLKALAQEQRMQSRAAQQRSIGSHAGSVRGRVNSQPATGVSQARRQYLSHCSSKVGSYQSEERNPMIENFKTDLILRAGQLSHQVILERGFYPVTADTFKKRHTVPKECSCPDAEDIAQSSSAKPSL